MMKAKYLVASLLLIPLLLSAQNIDNHRQSLFPLMKNIIEKAESMGIEFPAPYGLSAGMYQQNQKMEIKQISVGSIVLDDKNDFVNIASSSIENTTMSSQLRADVWVLPFMNLYGMVGRVTTFNDLKLRF